ncbi:MAG TPA: NTP transferase domain-containing protein, partial [Chloroflexota bacterium]|nr:NTP transferase domain-containing protein [Chloroflexota bacterium]
MRSRRPKVLHPLVGQPLICRVLDVVRSTGADHIVVVLGHQADQVRAVLAESVDSVVQEPQLGTGHAVQRAAPRLQHIGADRLLVHLGDAALVRPESLRRLVEQDVGPAAPIALLTARVSDPSGYGRVLRLADGTVDRTVEEADASPRERSANEIWSGSMLLWTPWLWDHLARLPVSPKGEYYLPELVNVARQEHLAVAAVLTEDEDEVQGINDRVELARAQAILRRRTLEGVMRSGVTIVDPATTYIEPE